MKKSARPGTPGSRPRTLGSVPICGLVAIMVFTTAAATAAAAAAKKADTGPKLIDKDDGIIYPEKSAEKLKPIKLSSMVLKVKYKVELPAFDDVLTWSRIKKDTADEPKTYIRLPLKWPIDTRNWTSAPNALKYLITHEPNLFMSVDVNLDGKWGGARESINRDNDGIYGPIDIRLKYEDGSFAFYSLVIKADSEDSNRYFRFRTNVAWEGYLPSSKKKRDSEKIVIFDANNNALFDDYGFDLIKVGNKPPMPLPQLILIKGRLYHIRVHPSGSVVHTKPYDGATGRLDMFSGLKLPRRTEMGSLLVQNAAGTLTLDISPSSKKSSRSDKKPVELPVGKYHIWKGVLSTRGSTAIVRQGEMPPMEVENGKTTVVEWGKPYEFSTEVDLNINGLNIDKIRVFGRAKESYTTEGRQAPVVTVRFKGRTIMRDYLTIDNEGAFATWFHEPQLKGIYKVSLELKHKILGNLKVPEQELAFKPAYN